MKMCISAPEGRKKNKINSHDIWERQTARERESRVTWGSMRDYSVSRQDHRGNRARGMEEVKVWPKESVAASECGLAPAANDLIAAADESIQSVMSQWIKGRDGAEYELQPVITTLWYTRTTNTRLNNQFSCLWTGFYCNKDYFNLDC